MIQITLQGITGIALSSNMNPDDYAGVSAALPQCARVAIVNLLPNDTMMRVITTILGSGSELFHYMGRYRYLNGALLENADSIEKLVGSRAFFLEHKQSLPTLTRVATNQWHMNKIRLVLFEESMDGYYSFLRGCGLEFPEMEDDTIGPSRRPPLPLSVVSKYFLNACEFLAPFYTVNPAGHDGAMTEIYSTIALWVEEGIASSAMAAFKSRVQGATDSAMQNAQMQAQETRLVDGLAICDFRTLLRRGEPVSFTHWNTLVAQQHRPCVLCSISPGFEEDRVRVDLRAWGRPVDLERLMPDITTGRRSMVWIPLSRWNDFVLAWKLHQQKS